MERNDFYVYVLLRPETGIPFYVGKGSGKRVGSHMHDERGNSHKANIIRRMKEQGLQLESIKLRTGLTEKEAFAFEIELIAKIGREPLGPLVNKTPGGDGVSGARSACEIARLVALHIGRKRSASTRAAIGAKQKGRKRSPEQLAKQSLAMRGRRMSPERLAIHRSAMKGKKCAEGTRLALIESNKRRAGFKWSPEFRERMMAARAAKRVQL